MSTQIILNLYNLMHVNNLLSVFINVSLVKVILQSNLFNAEKASWCLSWVDTWSMHWITKPKTLRQEWFCSCYHNYWLCVVVHVGVPCVGSVKISVRVRSGSIPIPCDEMDKFNLIFLTKMFVNCSTLELSRQVIYQYLHEKICIVVCSINEMHPLFKGANIWCKALRGNTVWRLKRTIFGCGFYGAWQSFVQVSHCCVFVKGVLDIPGIHDTWKHFSKLHATFAPLYPAILFKLNFIIATLVLKECIKLWWETLLLLKRWELKVFWKFFW